MALDFFAGCLGGCAGVIVGHPLDTVKVHLQTQDPKNPKYTGTIHCIKSLAAKEGIRGLYRGMASPLAGVAAVNAVIFGVYGNTQRRMSDPDALHSHVVAGAVAGLSQSWLVSPIELAKTRIQISNSNKGPLHCIQNIYRDQGYRGVFKGFGITVMREIPAFASYFLTYELMTRTSGGHHHVSTLTMLTAGGLAGMVSWVIVYPVDVIKSRLQIDGMSGSPKYTGIWDCLNKSIKSEGYGFLSRGILPTVIRAFPVNAACFTVVTWTLRLAESKKHADKNNMGYSYDSVKFWEMCEEAVSYYGSTSSAAATFGG